ncbi:hypothetical protein K493DRAFT_333619 [Basidiobolus meristosporus CBS 931.73]|uniref:Uncharacterized protein n=1 Tax=Basidiobolus meristosporus CBS 931.73 TaxID=1314790 RepID=A0A1Y1Z5H4_9FUNG|nr:hypothetical protein K493DRAFT_333619 [Basidiobolus meristosporus CBS 931.73]|eukprot:ORY05227.1 hypothetical protein K493DRAFT_333619 [Basidiobolus meristosporus CBS 931.73]
MEARRSSSPTTICSNRPKKHVDYAVNPEVDPLFQPKPKFEDLTAGTERKKIVDSVSKEGPESSYRESKRSRLSATERREQADIKKALELSLVEEDCIDMGRVDRTVVKDIWADPNFFGNQERPTSRRKERLLPNNNTAPEPIPQEQQRIVSQEKAEPSSNTSTPSGPVETPSVKVKEGHSEAKNSKQVPSPKEIEDLFDDGDLSDTKDILSDDEMALIPHGRPRTKPQSTPNQDTRKRIVKQKEEHKQASSSEEDTHPSLATASAMTEVNIVIPKVSLKTAPSEDVSIVIDDEITTPKRVSPRTARKKPASSSRSSDNEFEHSEGNAKPKRASRGSANPIPRVDSLVSEDESGSEFEETLKSKRKVKSPMKPKRKKLAAPKVSKTEETTDSDSVGKESDTMESNVQQNVEDATPNTPKATRTPKSRNATPNCPTTNNTINRTPSVGLKVSSSLKPLLVTKPTVPANDSAQSSSRSPVISGGPARVGLSRRHKFKPLHPYLQSPSKIPQP